MESEQSFCSPIDPIISILPIIISITSSIGQLVCSQCSSTTATAEVEKRGRRGRYTGTSHPPVRKPVLEPIIGYTWNDDGVNSLVVTLNEPSQGPVEHGTEVQQPWLQAVRQENVRKVEVTYRERLDCFCTYTSYTPPRTNDKVNDCRTSYGSSPFLRP